MATQVKGRSGSRAGLLAWLLGCALAWGIGSAAQAATISGTVRNDQNGNGVLDAADPGQPNILVQLRTGATRGFVLAQVRTDASGNFAFTNVGGGTYRLVQVPPQGAVSLSALPGAGGVIVDPNTIRLTLTGAEVSAGHTYLLRASTAVGSTSGSISGAVFRDVNGNSLIDAGDVGIAGVQIQLFTAVGTFVAATLTGAGGVYSLTALPPGFYQVVEVDPPNHTSVAAFGGVNGFPLDANRIQVAVTAGVNSSGNSFLDRLADGGPTTGSITGLVARDLNGNSVIDGGDVALAGVTVSLFSQNGTFITQATTGVNGVYAFTGLLPGTYRVVEQDPLNHVSVAAFPGLNSVLVDANTLLVTVVAGADAGNNNFLDRLTAVSPTVGNIAGAVFQDQNANGILDAGDLPLGGATVQLLTATGIFITQVTTDASGAYTFSNLPPGSYRVVEQEPSGYVSVAAVPGANAFLIDSNTLQVSVLAGGTSGANNFLDRALVPPPVGGANTISGFVVRDQNLNGIPDNEPGLANAVVTLRNSLGVAVGTAVTDVTGQFAFSGLAAGTYTVTVTPPAGLTNTNAIAGLGGARVNAGTITVTATAGQTVYPGQLFLAGP